MWQNAQASLRFTERFLSYSISLPSSSTCWTWLSGGAASRSSVCVSTRSISASTCAISFSASGVSVVTSSAPTVLALRMAAMAIGASTTPAIEALIQHRLDIVCRSILSRRASATGLEQKPRSPLGLVDEIFQQAGGGDVVVLIAQSVRLAHIARQLLIVFTQLGKHVARRDIARVVVQDPLHTRNLADRPQRRAADLARTFGDCIGCSEDLLALLVKQKMIVAEMRARYVPMKILRF